MRQSLAMITTLISFCACFAPTLFGDSCPDANSLIRDHKTLIWSSRQGDWKSYAPSFSRKVEQFMGAQWQGVNVGNLFCIYQGDSQSFLITLQYHNVVKEPSGGLWGTNENGLRNCRSQQQSDCPFVPAPINQPIDINKAIDQINPLSSPSTPDTSNGN